MSSTQLTQKVTKLFSNTPEVTAPIRQRIMTFLTDDGWNFQQDKYSLNTRVRCKNAVFPIYIYILEENPTIQVYSYLDTVIPENKRAAVSEFCTRVNHNMPIGNFEFDMDEGEVRYKTSIALGNNIEFLTDELLDRLIVTNYSNMDLYYPGFMQINFSDNVDVKTIVEEIENPKKE